MTPLAALAPAWIGFEVLQLVACERLLGVKQIQAGKDPRDTEPRELVAFIWSFFIVLYWAWIAAMLYERIGLPQVIALSAVSLAGQAIRRVCGLRWVLIVLTFEGAIRIGMLVSFTVLLWRTPPT